MAHDFVTVLSAAALLGAALGFIFTGLINNLFEYANRVADRRERIAAARTRDHSKVPDIHAAVAVSPIEWEAQ